MSPDAEPQWPPRSPGEALLSTPRGRQRHREMLNRASPSPSPSPSKRPRPMPASGSPPGGRLGFQVDDDDDEETLQLKLQEIQTRLRLKKMQNAKNKDNVSLQRGAERGSGPCQAASANDLRRQARGTTPDADHTARRATCTQVQVPASPVRKVQAPQQHTSPRRVLLGIDKGLKAKDVSLKRPPNPRSSKGGGNSQSGGYLTRSRPSNPPTASCTAPRPQTFNERLASARTEEAFQVQRQDKIQKVRTNAFGIGKREMEEYKKNAVDIPDKPLQAPTFSRDQILSEDKPSSGQLSRRKTAPTLCQPLHADPFSDKSSQNAASGDESSSFESYSCFHLSRRALPHRVLARHLSGKKTLNVKELLKDVKSPDYSLPDIEQDIVVFAIVAKKSEPRAHKTAVANNGSQAEGRVKYMVMTLVDLDFELDLFLFDSGFTAFWKLTEGTVVAILNPSIMPPPPGKQDTGRFSLVINSDADTILEIGSARDLGFCQSMKKDGNACGAWVNKKRTQFCEFHSNEAIRKRRSTRMEVNSTGFGGGREGRQNKGNGSKDWNGGKRKGPDNYDWETKSQWFTSRLYSAADLIDGKDRAPADTKEKSEFLKRSLEAKEKEREMMRKLGRVGNAAGREYMQHAGERAVGDGLVSSASSRAPASDDCERRLETISLDLQKGKDRTIHLSPVKRKRTESSRTGSTASNAKSSAYGWGGNLRDKLSSMKDGQKLHRGGTSPVRKKTRFVTEKGIREAGRESLGMDPSQRQVSLGGDDDEDDELVIVR